MATTINDITGALATLLGGVDGLVAYSEAVENPVSPKGGATAEIILTDARQVMLAEGGFNKALFDIEVSCPSEGAGWERGEQIINDYLGLSGTNGLNTVIGTEQRLPGLDTPLVTFESSGPVRRVQYGTTWRWAGRVVVSVVWSA